ncbi:MAG: DUF4878 domain-containing protein [Bacteroidales bacterium]
MNTKKTSLFLLFLFTILCLVSCSNKHTPGNKAKATMEYLYQGDFEKYVDGVSFATDTTEENRTANKALLLSFMKEKGPELKKEKGEVKKIEIISENINPDKKTAKVVLKITYASGKSETENVDMKKIKGDWKIYLDK